MADKSKLLVWHVPFTIKVEGSVSVLAATSAEAKAAVEAKIEDGSFGVDDENIAEEGIFHDGSVNFVKLKGNTPELSVATPTDDKPEEHNDWDAFEDDEADAED